MKNALIYLGKAIFWGLLFLLLTELAIRLLFLNPTPMEEYAGLGSRPAPDSVSVSGLEGYSITRYGEFGEVHTPYSGGDNIVILGDSFTESRHMMDWETYPSVAENLLRASGADYDVRNLGYRGLTFVDYVGLAPFVLEHFRPRLVVIQTAPAEILENPLAKGQGYYFVLNAGGDLIVKARNQKPVREKNQIEQILSLSAIRQYASIIKRFRSAPNANLLANILDDPGAADSEAATSQVPASEQPDPAERELLARKEFAALKKAYGDVPVIILMLPDRGIDKDLNPPAFREQPEVNLLVDLARQQGIVTIYPASAFNQLLKDGYSPLGFWNTGPFGGHMNAYGNRLLGELLAPQILEILK